MPGPQWYPGDSAVGTRVNPEQNLFVKPPLMQSGVATTAPTAATPGTIASGGTVSIPGSSVAGETATYLVPYGSTVTISYTGTLSWVWLAK